MEDLDVLKRFGFVCVGHWELDSNLKYGARCRLTSLTNERVLYAFVVNNSVKYVGICEKDSTSLKKRMSRYQSRAGGSTNSRINNYINELLKSRNEVFIYALKPNLIQKFEDLQLDLIKGLENPLINHFDPDWNYSKGKSTK